MFKHSITKELGCAMDGLPVEAYDETDQTKLRMWGFVHKLERASSILEGQMATACWIDTGIEHKLKNIYIELDSLAHEIKQDFIKHKKENE